MSDLKLKDVDNDKDYLIIKSWVYKDSMKYLDIEIEKAVKN